MYRPAAALLILFVFPMLALGQNDTIISKSGDLLVGEIKSMGKGILQLKTDYSDKDFEIEWNEISRLKTHRTFLIYLSDGQRLNGSVVSQTGDPPIVLISTSSGSMLIDEIHEITYLKPIEKSFLGRMDASLEIGYSFTKAHHQHQFNTRSYLGYIADNWGADASVDIIRSRQDSVAPTRRTEGSIGARILFNRSWFLSLSNNLLQSDEQKLRLRSTTNASFGHLFINTSRSYWGASAGLAYNFEDFTTDQSSESSLEGLLSTELNLFAHENLSLLTSVKVYPSLTVKKRIRSDFKLDLKYDLPLDFFIKVGFTHNYDNKAVAGASSADYVIKTSFGWEL